MLTGEHIIDFFIIFMVIVLGWLVYREVSREQESREVLEDEAVSEEEYRKAKEVVWDWVDEYRRKIIGCNRFLLDVDLLQQSFPEYPRHIIERLWKDLVAEGKVQEDMFDRQWEIKP